MMTPRWISRHRLALVAVFAGLSLASAPLRAEPSKPTQEESEAVFVELTMVEVPAEASREVGLAERLPDLGLVLSDAEAKKLIQAGQNAPGCNVVQAPRVRTGIGRSAIIGGTIGDRRVACVVLPESAASNGEIKLRIAPVPAVRSPAEIAASDPTALFAATRVSATADLKKDESMMLGGWKTGKDGSGTLVLIVKPQVATDVAARPEPSNQTPGSTMSMMSMVDPRIVIQEEEEERLGVVPDVSTARKPAAAAASARPVKPTPLRRSARRGENGPQQVLLSIKVVEIDEGKLKRLGFDFSLAPSSIAISQGECAGGLPVTTTLGPADKLPGVVEALRKEGLARVLAEPTLVTVSGKPASLRIGDEIPYTASQGAGRVSIDWQHYGVKATFLPQVLDNGHIRVELLFEDSQVDRTKTGIVAGKENPAIRLRTIDIGWEAKPGQTLALAARSATALTDAKDSLGPTVLMLVTPQIVDSVAAIPSPGKAKSRGVDAVR